MPEVALPSSYKQYRFVKVNNESMVAWVPDLSGTQVILYEINENNEGKCAYYNPFASPTFIKRVLVDYPIKILGLGSIIYDIW